MNLNDPGEFRAPRRWPWLLLVVALVALAVVLHRRKGGGTPKAEPHASAAAPAPVPSRLASAVPATSPSPAPVGVLSDRALNEGDTLEKAGRLLDARSLYLGSLKAASNADVRTALETRLGRVNVELILSQAPMPEKVEYVVQKGDSLDKIAKKFGTTMELAQRINQIANPARLRLGDKLRIVSAKFSIRVSKRNNDLVLQMNDTFFKRYPVGTGKFDKTPVGTFVIIDKIKEPTWWRPDGREIPYGDKENILGTRWMSIRATGDTPDVRGYGIHGTWDDSSIGKAESAGCIRMKNADVEELFCVVPLNAPVVIGD